MVRLTDFDKIVYKRPRVFRYDKSLQKIVGFDSEAYRSGKTFLFTTSHGDILTPGNLLDYLFSDDLVGSNFVTWNLKYESGAILKIFPYRVLKALQVNHVVTTVFKGVRYRISYLPHKQLKIKIGRKTVRFWDISPFYGRMKLGTAAKEYLDETKTEGMDPNLFTPGYVEKHFSEIASYCIQDSVLTRKLAELWIGKFEETGIPVTSLYSEASISFTYISRKAEIVTPYEYWNSQNKLLRYAFESYEGGKFEIIARGKFSGFEYDISSAYPFEIANLVDIRSAVILYSRRYNREAVYGFLRVRIQLKNPGIRLPCGLFKKLRIYPMGVYYLTITKQEYDYIKTLGISVKIIDAAWIIVPRISYPYRNVISELYQLKQEWKKKDKIRSHNYKIVMNGFYGKMAQCIATPEGTYLAGQGWNPVYASVITANTRIAVTKLQNLLGSDCLAVHTDSVITKKKIPSSYLGERLGDFELVVSGDGVIVACGIYEIAGQSALKGFRVFRKDEKDQDYQVPIIQILKEHPKEKVIQLYMRHVESWTQALAKNHEMETINVFDEQFEKELKLNCDTKRIWPNDVTAEDLLNELQYSAPLVEHHEKIPSYWKE
jgi:hypothetical protein